MDNQQSDTISRAELLETMKSAIDDAPLYIQATVDQMITEAPSVPPQVHGRWEFVNDYESRCSVCGMEVAMDHENEYPNCPYCTAKMGGEDDAAVIPHRADHFCSYGEPREAQDA